MIRYLGRSNVARGLSTAAVKVLKKPVDPQIERLMEKYKGSIFYSSFLEDNIVKLGYERNKMMQLHVQAAFKAERKEASNVKPFPLALQYLDPSVKQMEDLTKIRTRQPTTVVLEYPDSQRSDTQPAEKEQPVRDYTWMKDYEYYEDDEEVDAPVYGSADPNIAPSSVPCGGCGARLHCMDESFPGYVPREIFKGRAREELQTMVCQRCHFLKNYNTALNISVPSEEYVRLLSTIKNKFGLLILIVDLLDIPCSIWPNILDIVGHNRPIFVVGNKVDLIPRDSLGYLEHIRKCLIRQIQDSGIPERNLKHVSLISATTGFGVEELITALHNKWGREGDVYLVGVTNVGKSSLFNALLRSDYCRSQASDLVQRATASPWPGTTIRMLKFPILRISDAKSFRRTSRLIEERAEKAAEMKLRQIQAKETGKPEHGTLIGHIKQTFKITNPDEANSFSMGKSTADIFALDENDKSFVQSKWCYDTPGVITPDQIYDKLSIEELMLVKPKVMMRPRTYLLKPEMSLFLAGLGRLDFLEGPPFVRVQVCSSLELPILICATESADEIYQELLHTPIFMVPVADEERLQEWPEMVCGPEITIHGENSARIAGDIVLSSCGWLGINVEQDRTASFRAFTPGGAGIYFRQPALLPKGLRLKGARIRHSLAYKTGKAFVKQ